MLNAVLQRLVDERTNLHDSVDQVLASANDEERDPSEAETSLLQRHRTRLEELEPQIEELLRTEETRQSAADARRFLTRATPARPNAEAEEPAEGQAVYRNFGQYARDEIITRFPMIATRAGVGARDAAEQRLERAVANTLTADIPGLLPVQHLDQIIGVINKTRPLVSAARQIGLTSGQITYPAITGRPIVDVQTAEKTELPSAKMTVAMRTASAAVYGGSGDLSWQDVVWSNPDALSLWFDLAAEAYAHRTEKAACDALVAAVTSTAIAIATDTLADWIAGVTAAAGQIYAASGHRPDVLVTNIANGYTLLGIVGSTTPVFLTAGPGDLSTGTGQIAGLRIVISPQMPVDKALVGDSGALLCAETPSAPVELRAVEPSIAGFEVGVVGAFATVVTDPTAFANLNPPGLD